MAAAAGAGASAASSAASSVASSAASSPLIAAPAQQGHPGLPLLDIAAAASDVAQYVVVTLGLGPKPGQSQSVMSSATVAQILAENNKLKVELRQTAVKVSSLETQLRTLRTQGVAVAHADKLYALRAGDPPFHANYLGDAYPPYSPT